MITTRSSVRTEVIYSDDMNHRLILKKDWSRDKEKLKCTIIMINPSTADEIEMDRTTMNIINNLKRLNYTSVDICNLFSYITPKLKIGDSLEDLLHPENDIYIEKSALKCDSLIIAWGSFGDGSKKMMQRQEELLEKLKPFRNKTFYISDEYGVKMYHPLSPKVSTWNLVHWKN